jgi:hypothetical protein
MKTLELLIANTSSTTGTKDISLGLAITQSVIKLSSIPGIVVSARFTSISIVLRL